MPSHIREKKKAIKVKCTQHAIKPFNDLNLSVFRFTAISNKICHGCEAMLELLECRSGCKLMHTDLLHLHPSPVCSGA